MVRTATVKRAGDTLEKFLERKDALIGLKGAEERIPYWCAHARTMRTVFVVAGFTFAAVSFWTFFEQRLLGLSMVCLIVATNCAVGYILLTYAQVLLNSMSVSLKAQRTDFVRQETVLLSIHEALADLVASEFHKLGYPKRYHGEASVEISKHLAKDLRELSLELIDSETAVSKWFRELRGSEGMLRIEGLDGFLTTTGFNKEALDELKDLIDEKYAIFRQIIEHSEVNTDTAVRLVLAMQQVDQALDTARTFHEDQSLVGLEEIREARQAAAE